jgi:hypothetical protein
MENEGILFRRGQIVIAIVLTSCFLFFVIESLNWPWMNDAQVFHYITFLIRHGMSPYRQIPDINWPGSYFSTFFGIFLFGSSDLGWRLYDYSILLFLIASCILISSRHDWIAGLYGGILFALIHGAEGPWQTAQRDEVLIALVLGGYALTFLGVRNRQSIFFLFAAILIALAGTIKPTALVFGLLLLVLALNQLRKLGIGVQPYLRESVIGTAIVLIGTIGFLLWRHSFLAFFRILFGATAFYSSGNRLPFYFMLHHSTPRGLFVIIPLAIYLFFRNRSWENWEIRAIVGGMLVGSLSYWLQGKGFEYHRYPFLALALLWAGLEFVTALRTKERYRWVGVVGLLVGGLIVAPFYTMRVVHAEQSNALTLALIDDLRKFPPAEIQGSIQCLDGMVGCYSALYRLNLVQSTGMMGDQGIFSTRSSPVVERARADFLQEITAAPPMVFVVTNYWYGERQSFDMIDVWPEFAKFIQNNYTLVTEWLPPSPIPGAERLGYRIYHRNQEQHTNDSGSK